MTPCMQWISKETVVLLPFDPASSANPANLAVFQIISPCRRKLFRCVSLTLFLRCSMLGYLPEPYRQKSAFMPTRQNL